MLSIFWRPKYCASLLLQEGMRELNKSHQYAVDLFASECQKRIGIKPLEDDKLILKSAIDFRTYIETFKRLDHTVDWHKNLIEQLVKAKIDTLIARINKEYGTVQEYNDGVRQRSRPSSKSYQRNSEQTGSRLESIDSSHREVNDGASSKASNG